MSKEANIFALKGGEFYITERENDAFRIREGSVFVYIVPVKKSGAGRRVFLCEVMANEVLPSFYYTDSKGGYWRFCFVAREDARIEIVEDGATRLLKERFVDKANIRNYREEGFAGSLVDYYRIHVVTGDGFVRSNKKTQKRTEDQVQGLILQALKPARVIEKEERKRDNFLYQVFSGISKIRTAGLEDRVVYEYMKEELERQKKTEERERKTRNRKLCALTIKGILVLGLCMFFAYEARRPAGIEMLIWISLSVVFFELFDVILHRTLFERRKKSGVKVQNIFDAELEAEGDGGFPELFSGRIVMDQVTFAYDTEEVLKNIQLNIAPGEYVGITGPSGCGKSTLMKLLLGLEKPLYGKIFYDGNDMEQMDLQKLRKHMGVVLQDDKLISGSIYENITITAPDATPEQVNEAIKAVGLEEDLKDLPMGLFTLLSEDGETLSSGQRQRILIARALLRRPQIVLFDEATSALDQMAQNAVCETLEQMQATRVVVAHRMCTVKNCDRIIVMDNGRIVEQGDYEMLMNKKGMFYRLASRQIAE